MSFSTLLKFDLKDIAVKKKLNYMGCLLDINIWSKSLITLSSQNRSNDLSYFFAFFNQINKKKHPQNFC